MQQEETGNLESLGADTASDPNASGLRCIMNAAALSDVFSH